MVAYQKAIEYRKSIIDSIKALELEREKVQKKIESLAKETTKPEALLKGTGAEFKRLKEAQQELIFLNQRLEAIEEQGGVDGILRIDPIMNELANAILQENEKRLEKLVDRKNDLISRLSNIFEQVAELEQEVISHNDEVARLENEIDRYKKFMSADLPTKTSYRYKEARFLLQYQTFFNDFKRISELWKRQKQGGVVNE